jgi:hypothetical protein
MKFLTLLGFCAAAAGVASAHLDPDRVRIMDMGESTYLFRGSEPTVAGTDGCVDSAGLELYIYFASL